MTTAFLRLDADSASAADVAAIDRLLHQDAAAFSRPREHLETALERLDEAAVDRERIVLVAREGDAVVGLVDARLHHPGPGALTIAAIAVEPSRRRHKLGARLIEAAIAAASEADEVRALVAGVHAENARAIAFFEALGYAPEDRSAGVVVLARRREP